MTPAGDTSSSQKKHAMLPTFYSFRALGIPMIKDYSCCHLQEISGNNVVILFKWHVQYCYPRNCSLHSARTLLNIQQLALLGSNKTSFLPNNFGICCWPAIIIIINSFLIVTQNCWNGFSSEHVSVWVDLLKLTDYKDDMLQILSTVLTMVIL